MILDRATEPAGEDSQGSGRRGLLGPVPGLEPRAAAGRVVLYFRVQ